MIAWDGIERRRFVRVKVYFKTHIYDAEKASIITFAEEMSAKGMKVSIQRELKRSLVVDLEIYLREVPIACKGRVAWAKRVEGASLESGIVFDTGIEFRELSPEDQK